jgi:hypothetical protein
MATGLAVNRVSDKKLVSMAKKRVQMPDNWLELDYSRDSDVLLIRCSRNKAKRSKGDMRNGIVYDFDAQGKLVSIEVTDLLGIFATV